jgi:hypothetical protein
LSVFLLAIGCSDKKEAEPYQVERDQLIHNLILSIDQNKVPETNKALQRLHAIIRHDNFLDGLTKKTRINNYLIKADQAIKDDDLDTASLWITQSGNSDLQVQLEALISIKSYLQAKPFNQSKDFFKALKTINNLPLSKDEFPVYHQFIAREQLRAEKLKSEEDKAAIEKMENLFMKMIIASSKYFDLIKIVISDQKFTNKDLNQIVKDIKEFSPDLAEVPLSTFVERINKNPLPYAESLRRINQNLENGNNEQALSDLRALVKNQHRVSRKIQRYLISRSKKLRFFLEDQTFNLEVIIDKYYRQKELEEKEINNSLNSQNINEISIQQGEEINNEL